MKGLSIQQLTQIWLAALWIGLCKQTRNANPVHVLFLGFSAWLLASNQAGELLLSVIAGYVAWLVAGLVVRPVKVAITYTQTINQTAKMANETTAAELKTKEVTNQLVRRLNLKTRAEAEEVLGWLIKGLPAERQPQAQEMVSRIAQDLPEVAPDPEKNKSD